MKYEQVLVSLICSAAIGAGALAQSTFQGIGTLAGYSSTTAWAVSADGTTVVGWCGDGDNTLPVKWTSAGGLQRVGQFGSPRSGKAYAVNSNGTAICGEANEEWSLLSAFRWTPTDGIQYLNTPSGILFKVARGISATGDVLVGQSQAQFSGLHGTRWTAWGMTFPGTIQGYWATDALGVSGDGNSVVGICWTNSSSSFTFAYRWTGAAGIQDLGSLNPQEQFSYTVPSAISLDGSSIVGWSQLPGNQTRAFRWTQASGMVSLGLPANSGATLSVARAVSGTGEVVIGEASAFQALDVACYWTQSAGMRSLRDVITHDYGLDVRGWCLTRANGISADGKTIVGIGLNPLAQTEGWVIQLGEPLETPSCDADWDKDGFVSGDDFDAFTAAFEQGSRLADFDGNCYVNGDDFDAFVIAFEGGC